MDEKVKSIQERLRASLSQKFSLDQGPLGMPVVTFEQVSTAPTGAEELVANVVRELKSRGYRVAHIKRYSENMVPATLCEFQAESVGADISLTAVPGYVITERPVEGDASIESMVDAVRDACDVVVGESFGYAPVPKILITEKPQESFNLGLPGVVAYVSEKDAHALMPRFSVRDHSLIADKIEAEIIKPFGKDAVREEETERIV